MFIYISSIVINFHSIFINFKCNHYIQANKLIEILISVTNVSENGFIQHENEEKYHSQEKTEFQFSVFGFQNWISGNPWKSAWILLVKN